MMPCSCNQNDANDKELYVGGTCVLSAYCKLGTFVAILYSILHALYTYYMHYI